MEEEIRLRHHYKGIKGLGKQPCTHTVGDLVKALNEHFKDTEWFVCHNCNELEKGSPFYYTTEEGDRPFCHCCLEYCARHDERYPFCNSYKHEDCPHDLN